MANADTPYNESPRDPVWPHRHTIILFIAGLGVGWLLGLSTSPVLHIAIAAIMAVATGAVASLANRSDRDATSTTALVTSDPIPLAAVVIGIAIAATVGTVVRANELLLKPDWLVRRWISAGLGPGEAATGVFKTFHPDGASPAVASTSKKLRIPEKAISTGVGVGVGVNAFSVADCRYVSGGEGNELRERLIALQQRPINAALERCQSSDCLEALKEVVCWREQ